jgi:hypothetical protein
VARTDLSRNRASPPMDVKATSVDVAGRRDNLRLQQRETKVFG